MKKNKVSLIVTGLVVTVGLSVAATWAGREILNAGSSNKDASLVDTKNTYVIEETIETVKPMVEIPLEVENFTTHSETISEKNQEVTTEAEPTEIVVEYPLVVESLSPEPAAERQVEIVEAKPEENETEAPVVSTDLSEEPVESVPTETVTENTYEPEPSAQENSDPVVKESPKPKKSEARKSYAS